MGSTSFTAIVQNHLYFDNKWWLQDTFICLRKATNSHPAKWNRDMVLHKQVSSTWIIYIVLALFSFFHRTNHTWLFQRLCTVCLFIKKRIYVRKYIYSGLCLITPYCVLLKWHQYLCCWISDCCGISASIWPQKLSQTCFINFGSSQSLLELPTTLKFPVLHMKWDHMLSLENWTQFINGSDFFWV